MRCLSSASMGICSSASLATASSTFSGLVFFSGGIMTPNRPPLQPVTTLRNLQRAPCKPIRCDLAHFESSESEGTRKR